MNGSSTSIVKLLDGVMSGLSDLGLTACEVMVFPSHGYLDLVARTVTGSQIGVGSQDVDVRGSGSVTGAVSAEMVRDLGGTHSIIGHSERRTLFGEADEVIAVKFERCLDAGLIPIVCVGESLAERQSGRTIEVVTRQLNAVTSEVGREKFAGALVAYEPVWAIGTGESATPEQAEEVHKALRDFLERVDGELAEKTQILYGGSVTPENAVALFEQDNVDGGLVGGASLKAESFVAICEAAENR